LGVAEGFRRSLDNETSNRATGARRIRVFLADSIPEVPRDALAAGPFRNAQVREPDRPCQRCSDAVRAVRPYKDKVRAS
jgi:hypothetical protein